MKPATEILLSAAFALTPKENWWQQQIRPGDFCAYLAIFHAAHTLFPDEPIPAQIRANNLLCKVIGGHHETYIIDWNDARERKHSEVLAALYKAAELSEAA